MSGPPKLDAILTGFDELFSGRYVLPSRTNLCPTVTYLCFMLQKSGTPHEQCSPMCCKLCFLCTVTCTCIVMCLCFTPQQSVLPCTASCASRVVQLVFMLQYNLYSLMQHVPPAQCNVYLGATRASCVVQLVLPYAPK